MITYFLKGILIGLLFGLPVGAVGTMTVQRTWSFGLKAGLLTGLGSSVADCLYAVIGAFGLTIISDFLLRYRMLISILGGGFILFMGIRLILKKEEAAITQEKTMGGMRMFLSSFAVGITNPAAILTFLFAFSYFSISAAEGLFGGSLLVCGVLIGTYFWWGALSVMTFCIKKRMKSHSFRYMNRLFGTILTAFALIIFVRCKTDQTPENQQQKESLSTESPSKQTAPTQEPSPQTDIPDGTVNDEEDNVKNIQVAVGDKTFTATLAENIAVDAFLELMCEEPLVINMSDYSGFEKVGSLGTSLPSSNSSITTSEGDIVLYNSSQIVVFYGSNSWSYTKLAKIVDLSGWKEALGDGDVAITFSIK